MESERDHNVDHPDRLQVWEAPSHTRSARTFNPPIRYLLPECWQTN